jgi:ribonuclease I
MSPDSAQHEWTGHGSCTRFTAAEYFDTIRLARSAVQIPVQIASPDDGAPEPDARVVESEFSAANPGFPAGALRASLSAVEICFDTEIRPAACP